MLHPIASKDNLYSPIPSIPYFPPFNLLTLRLNVGWMFVWFLCLLRSPEGAAPFKVSQTSRGAGRTTTSFNTSQRLERSAAVLRIHAAQKNKKNKPSVMRWRDINSPSGVQRVFAAKGSSLYYFSIYFYFFLRDDKVL